METDHKPLIQLLGQKGLDELPPRIQRLRMRLLRFQYTIIHVPGKDLITADALSRQPVSPPQTIDKQYEREFAEYISIVIQSSPVPSQQVSQSKVPPEESPGGFNKDSVVAFETY